MKQSHVFVTGISTEVGKTVASAVITQSLNADYWKPVQAGDLDHTDSDKVAGWISNSRTVIHPTTYRLHTPMSPHAAAEIDDVTIEIGKLTRPATENILVIEGAGGLLVPLNTNNCIIDLIHPDDLIVLVSRHYLGSINHTLLSIEALKSRGLSRISLLFIGDEHPTTESIILKKSGLKSLGRIDEVSEINKEMVDKYAKRLQAELVKAI